MATVRLEKPDGVVVDVSVESGGDLARACRIGDHEFTVAVVSRDEYRGFLIHDHRVRRYCVQRGKRVVDVWVDGRLYRLSIPSRTARRHGESESARPAGDIIATMPGTVLKIEVAAGDRFAAHQPLVIMESMKMEMTLSSPAAGRVAEVACRAGQLVAIGAVLIRLEPDKV